MSAALAQAAAMPPLTVGTPWLFHYELEITDCEGQFEFFDLSHKGIAEARCNGCGTEWSVRKNEARRDLEPREERWYQR